ncbi:MAG TPA: MBOAT family O-acyltransferase [Verrucomicrobiae bacterium]|nr:MBOAT family O-acyltransferase [Verrucomicrobiae bacterium]
MTFNASLLDLRFTGLLVLVGLLRGVIPQRFYVLFGVAASGLILGLAAPGTFLAISLTTVLVVYPIHRLMRLAEKRGCSPRVSTALLATGVTILVALMVLFKVYRHFTLPWLGNQWLRGEVLGLIGFSYFIFRAIGFLHIQSILKITLPTPWPLLFFTLFPPTLTSGPIQKFQDFNEQLTKPEPLTSSLVFTAVYRITRGYFRKLVLAVLLNKAAEPLLAMPQPSIYISVLAITAMYLYFYFDFAGYSDIAIGFGLLLGIRVPENFRKPFLATTVSEFWRNWHITLADWFRDQFFIPLGGMKSSRLWAASLAFSVMVLCGFWHGLTYSFFAWGIWHGLVLFAEALSGAKPIPPSLRHGPKYWSKVLWTNARVAIGAIFFLPTDTTLRLLGGIARWRLF